MQPHDSKEKRIVDALYRVNNFLSCVNDLHLLMKLIMEESKNVLNAEASSLMLFDAESEELFFEVALGDKGEAVKEIRVPISEGIAGACARNRKIVVVQDCSKDSRHFKKADEKSHFITRNILAAPMVRNNKLIGVLEVLNKNSSEEWNEEDEKVLDFFSSQAAIAIENAQLIQSNIQSERLAAIGQAVAGISHYIKNILAGIKGSSGLVSMGLQQKNLELITDAWPILERSNKKITELVQDMLTYSKYREPELEPVDLNSMIDEIIKLSAERAKDSNIHIEVRKDYSITECNLDSGRLYDTILNIISNAIDALKEREDAKICVSTNMLESGAHFLINIEDNGCGIPPEIKKKIFDPFFSTKGSKGTGLGLACAKKIVEEHRGKISVVSEINVGTKFIIQLPVDPKKEEK